MTQRIGLVGIVSTIVAVLLAIFSVVLPPVVPGQLATLPFVIIVLLVVAAAIFWLVVPRAARSDRPGLVGFVGSFLGLLLVLPAFWSGLPIVLGTGGALLGQVARDRAGATGRRGGLGIWALVIGIVALILDLIIFWVDRFS